MLKKENKNSKNKISKKAAAKPKGEAVRIEVVKTDYLSHEFSPHTVNLRKFAPVKSIEEVFITAEAPVSYFSAAEIKSLNTKEQKPLAASFVDLAAEERIKELRQEIETMENAAVYDWPAIMAVRPGEEVIEIDRETWELPEIKPAAEKISLTKIKKTSFDRRGKVKKVMIYLDLRVNRLVQPLRNLPLSLPVKASIGFAVLALFLVLPLCGVSYYRSLQGRANGVIDSAKAAAVNLSSAGQAVGTENYNGANQEFNSAYQKFSTAKEELASINKIVTVLASLLPSTGKTLTSAQALLQIGQDLSVIGQNLTSGLANWEDADKTLADKISGLERNLTASLPLVNEVNELAKKVDPGLLPPSEQVTFISLQKKMPLIASSFSKFAVLAGFANEVLGQKELKRYLVLFQNNHEIRPTGGFLGSYALLDLVNGEIKNIEIPPGGSYDLQGSLKVKVAAPQPLRLINPRWEFQDSNWFSDWPAAAQKIIWFYNQAGGPTVDGVIAINADLFADLLKIIGPVEASGQKITADNFFDVTQQEVEINYDKAENKPKQFIANLAPEVLDKILSADKENFLAIASLLNIALESKNLQLYFTAPTTEQRLADFGWANNIKETSSDYLLVVDANIAGQKSDAVIEQKIFHQAIIGTDGSVRDKVTVIRTHNGTPGDLFYGVRNVNYLRLYVPPGSKLISASGLQEPAAELFKQAGGDYQQDSDLVRVSGLSRTDKASGVKISQEFGKTVLAGWTQVYPGKTMVTTFEYELPFKVTFAKYDTGFAWLNFLEEKLRLTEATTDYSLLAQKQSGVTSEFYSSVTWPDNWQAVWHYPDNLKITGGRLNYSNYLDQDRVYSVMFKR